MAKVYIKQQSNLKEITFTVEEARADSVDAHGYVTLENSRVKIKVETRNLPQEWGEGAWEQVLKLGEAVTVEIED